MYVLTVRRVAAGAMVAMLALTMPAAPGWAATESKEAVAAPIFVTEPAVPEPKITKDEALERLKQYFTLPRETASLTLDANLANENGHTTWEFMATMNYPNGSTGASIASVDAMTGRIRSFSAPSFLPAPIHLGPPAPARPEAEAREKAWKLVAEMYPDLAPNLKPVDPTLQGSPYSYYYMLRNTGDSYQFTWQPEVNGVPCPASSVIVGVDKATLAYTSLAANLPEGITYPPGPAKVDAKAAMDVWMAAAQPALIYAPIYPKSPYGIFKPTEFRLAYQFTVGQAVDAMTGKLTTEPYFVQPAGQPEVLPAGDVKPVLPAATPLTDAEAYRITAELFGLKDTHGIGTEGAMSSEANLIQLGVHDGQTGGNVAFDRDTGMPRGANRYRMSPSPMPAREPGEVSAETEAAARAAAIAVVQKYYSPWLQELRLLPNADPYWKQDDTVRRFTFARFVEGVRVATDSVGVTIDLDSLEWRDFHANWTTGIVFPKATPVYSPAEVTAAYFAGRTARLIYRPVQPKRDPMSYELPQPTEAELVYTLTGRDDTSLIDALTGRPLGWDGGAPSTLESALQQVQGHWAEGELRYMLASQAIDLGALNPDGALTRAQAVRMLLQRQSQMIGRDSRPVKLPYTDVVQDDPVLQAAYQEGWLTPGPADGRFLPDQPVTRAQFAVWAARALGLGDLARSPLSVVPVYGDMQGLSGEAVNAIHFLHYLGILKPADRFRPNDPLTQAEGAAITARIYNYLLAK